MTAILLALATSLAWGASDYTGGIASRTLRVPLVLSVQQASGLALVIPTVLLLGGPSSFQGHEAGYAVLSGVIVVGSLGFLFKAMAVGVISVVGPVTACGVAIPVAVGLAWGEQPGTVQLVGIAAAMLGVILASVERQASGGGRRLVAGLGFALGSAVCVGVWFVTFDMAASHDPYRAALVARATTVVLATAIVLLWRRPSLTGDAASSDSVFAPAPLPASAPAPLPASAPLSAPAVPHTSPALTKAPPALSHASPAAASRTRMAVLLVVASGLADAAGEVSYAVSTTVGLISVVSVIASLYPAFMVGYAALWLHERLARHQLAGVGLALLGIALISAG